MSPATQEAFSALLVTLRSFRYVNNTDADVSPWHTQIAHSVLTGEPLPEDIADLFTLEIRHDLNADGTPRGILRWA